MNTSPKEEYTVAHKGHCIKKVNRILNIAPHTNKKIAANKKGAANKKIAANKKVAENKKKLLRIKTRLLQIKKVAANKKAAENLTSCMTRQATLKLEPSIPLMLRRIKTADDISFFCVGNI